MEDKPYVLIVQAKVKPGRRDEFLAHFKPLAEYVNANEGGCLSYQLSLSEEDPDGLVIFERFISKAYLETVHWQSDAFKTFSENVKKADLWAEKSASKYIEAGTPSYGFMAR